MRIPVLGVGFDNVTMEQAVAEGVRLMNTEGAHYVVTPNPEIVETCQADSEAMEAVGRADLVIADGIGVVYGARILGTPLQGRVPGIDFATALVARLAQSGGRLFLLGAKPGVAEEAGARILEQYPDLVLCGTQDGYFRDEETVLLKVAAARPDLLFVCLGAPKQEKWMARWGRHTGARLAVVLGGALDVFAGKVERAPESWRKLGLEWAYRLKKEPQRAGRMAKLPLVLVKAAGEKWKRK